MDGRRVGGMVAKDETVQQRCKVWEMQKVNKLAFLLGIAARWHDGGG